MKKIAAGAPTSSQKDLVTKEYANLESEAELLTGAISVEDLPPFTPVEQAILDMDTQLQAGTRMIREIRNQSAMLETAFKLMTYELSVITKHYKKEE